MQLRLLPGLFAIARLGPRDPLPLWTSGAFVSITRTDDELSVVCSEDCMPEGVKCESGWRILKIAGPLDFVLTGVMSSIAAPLARAGVSIFAISTYDTDYVMVRDPDCHRAIQALTSAGHAVQKG